MNNFSLQIPVVTLPNMHKTAVLLTNLGSPDAPTSKALKPYLTEFLMDEKVMDISYLKSLLLVKGIIVPFRAKKKCR
jgi:ferrochelatase